MKKTHFLAVLFALISTTLFAASISGTVTDSAGNPIGQASVIAQNAYSQLLEAWTSTDENGIYILSGLDAGDCVVSVDASEMGYVREYYNDQTDFYSANYLTLSPVTDLTGIDFQLTLGSTINGTVLDINGDPIAGIFVSAYDYFTNEYCGDATTGVDGSYSILTLPFKSYRVSAYGEYDDDYLTQYYDHTPSWEQAAQVYVGEGDNVANINFDLEFQAILVGYVKDDLGNPIANVELSCWDDETQTGSWITTESDGSFCMTGLAIGVGYQVEVFPPSGSDYMMTRFDCFMSNSGENTISDIILQIGGFDLSGYVTVAADGTPLSFLNIGCYHEDLDMWCGSVLTSQAGYYEFNNLPPGEIYLFIEMVPAGLARQAKEIDIQSDMTNVDFALPIAANIYGKLVDSETGRGIPFIELEAENVDSSGGFWAMTDERGYFALEGLTGGISEVIARPNPDTGYAWSLPWGANLVHLNDGENKKGYISLKKGALVSGYVKDSSGNPLGDIEICYESKASECWTDTNMDGYFEFRMPIGEHKVYLDYEETECTSEPLMVTILDVDTPIALPDIVGYDETTGGTIEGSVINSTPLDPDSCYLIMAIDTSIAISPTDVYTLPIVNEIDLDIAGLYQIPALAPGTYDIYCCVINEESGMESVSTVAIASGINVATGTTVSDIDLAVQVGSVSVSGNVVNTEGSPILGSQVVITYASNGKFAGFADVDENGDFEIGNMSAGNYVLSISHPKYISYSSNITLSAGMNYDTTTVVLDFVGEQEFMDTDGNGAIDFGDLIHVSDNWLTSEETVDFNFDGFVDLRDLAMLSDAWLVEALWKN